MQGEHQAPTACCNLSLITTAIMFKTVAAKLAHNSTIPALAGNSDLKPLQEVIAAEKVVMQSCVRGPAPTALILTSRFQSSETQHGL
jgi:hypothetical protein